LFFLILLKSFNQKSRNFNHIVEHFYKLEDYLISIFCYLIVQIIMYIYLHNNFYIIYSLYIFLKYFAIKIVQMSYTFTEENRL